MKVKTITLKKVITKEMTLLLTAFFAVLFVPLLGIQSVTGPVVNAVLFLATFYIGIKNAVWLAIFPSFIALLSGILPLVMAPLIPFIIISNIILIFTFNYFYKSNFWLGIVSASFAKFIFLSIVSITLSNLFFNNFNVNQVVAIFGWHQLLTALVGGLIAFTVIQLIANITKLKQKNS